MFQNASSLRSLPASLEIERDSSVAQEKRTNNDVIKAINFFMPLSLAQNLSACPQKMGT